MSRYDTQNCSTHLITTLKLQPMRRMTKSFFKNHGSPVDLTNTRLPYLEPLQLHEIISVLTDETN